MWEYIYKAYVNVMPFYLRDLSIKRVWYLYRILQPNTKGQLYSVLPQNLQQELDMAVLAGNLQVLVHLVLHTEILNEWVNEVISKNVLGTYHVGDSMFLASFGVTSRSAKF